jgi:ABC-type lipoprotein release transport system permease subunit
MVTAAGFLGYYNSFNTYLGEGVDVVAIYDVESRTPFSGYVPAYLTDQIGGIKGVLAVSPEAITPCIIRNQTLFIRGVLPQEFCKLNTVSMVTGDFLNESSFDQVALGKRVADRLNVGVNDTVVVFATLADRYTELRVAGVYSTNSSMDDEALVQLNVGQWLCFNDYNWVTLIRAKIDVNLFQNAKLHETLAENASQTTPPPFTSNQHSTYQQLFFWSTVDFPIGKIGVTNTENIMQGFLDRYGVTKEAFVVLSVMVFCFSSATILVACQTLLLQHKRSLATLHSIGVSQKQLKFDVVCKVLPISLIASFLGSILAAVILSVLGNYGFLMALSHEVNFVVDPFMVVLNCLLMAGIVTLSIAHRRLD